MPRRIVVYALLALFAWATPAIAAIATLEEATAERVLGKPDAPVTIVEYASLGCSHCADFHRDTLPQIKAAYIDTGRVRLVFADFPLGGPAVAASMVARCAPQNAYFGLLDMFFREQARWAGAREPLKEIARIGRFAGLSDKDVDACIGLDPLLAAIRDRAEDASRRHGIDSTPTFVIEGTLIKGAQPFEAFRAVIDAALAKRGLVVTATKQDTPAPATKQVEPTTPAQQADKSSPGGFSQFVKRLRDWIARVF